LQHLKSKYGDGYTLLAKITLGDENNVQTSAASNTDDDKTHRFITFILNKFENSVLKESRDGFVNIHIHDNSVSLLSSLFSLIENVKLEYSIEYYVVTQTNLEQIFLNFASKQIDPETRFVKKRGPFSCC
jgi:hypothetical protein